MGPPLPAVAGHSGEPSLTATVGPETVLVISVIASIVDSHVAGQVLRERSDRPAYRRRVIPLPRQGWSSGSAARTTALLMATSSGSLEAKLEVGSLVRRPGAAAPLYALQAS
jgi:hypothetical protein